MRFRCVASLALLYVFRIAHTLLLLLLLRWWWWWWWLQVSVMPRAANLPPNSLTGACSTILDPAVFYLWVDGSARGNLISRLD
jgi:hypothetical protein